MEKYRFSNQRKSGKALEQNENYRETLKNNNIISEKNKEKIEQKKISNDEKQSNENTEEKNFINNIEKNITKKIRSEFENMDDIFNEVEKFNAKNILKGDLAEIYNEVIKDNADFKDNIFFVNLNHYENMVGNCDDKKISHTFKEYKKEELLKNQYLPTKELYNKYDRKAKIIKEKNEF